MEDAQIIDLYWQRDEAAITETAQKYGTLCRSIAKNILTVREDAEECVNDTYHQAWNAIPPHRPERLGAWLGKVVRNLALSRWEHDHAQKRYSGMTALLSELEECVPAPKTVEGELEDKELSRLISAWLRTLEREDRVVFVRRYWYGTALQDLAVERGVSPGKLAQKMFRLRRSLRNALEKEGVVL